MPSFPTATTVLDSILFRDAFGTPAMREVFSDHSLISRYVEVEIALARGEARCGVIPQAAADEIAQRTDVSALDVEALRRETDIVGYPILPLVHQMAQQCGEAGRYVHWARPRRTSWIVRWCCSSAPGSRSSKRTSPHCAASSPISPSATAIRRWPGAPICSRRCR